AGISVPFKFRMDSKIQEAIQKASPKNQALIDYQNKKPDYARKFVENPMASEDLDVGDLHARIRALVHHIRTWNGMPTEAARAPWAAGLSASRQQSFLQRSRGPHAIHPP